MIRSIQYLRALAALAVVCWHTGWTRTFLPAAGVDVFFVISGFIMVTVTKPGTTPIAFMTARIRRIVPLYWFVTLLLAAATLADWRWVLSSLLFWSDPPVLQPGWSLNYEMMFYLVFALCPLWLLSLVFIFGPFDPIVLEFVAGAWLGVAWKQGWPRRHGWTWIGAAACLFAMQVTFLPLWAWRALLWGVPATMTVIGGLALEAEGKLPTSRTLRALGDASYSIYLAHLPVIVLISGYFHPLPTAIALPSLVAVCTIAGLFLHHAVEKPLNKLWRSNELRAEDRGSYVDHSSTQHRRERQQGGRYRE